MKILVTGGAGYIGTVLVPELLRIGHVVVVVDTLKFWSHNLLGLFEDDCFFFMKEDARNVVKWLTPEIDAVIHLAALRLSECQDKTEAESVNVLATANIAEWCAKNGKKLIFPSSCSVYGVTEDLVDEEWELKPTTTYAATKMRAEEFVLGAGGIVLRLATVYGWSSNMRWDTIVNRFVADAVRNRRIEVYSPRSWRPIVHVSDAVRAFVLMLGVHRDAIYNVGEQNYAKLEIANALLEYFPDVMVQTVYKQDPRSYRVSFDKIFDELGFRAARSVYENALEA